ncbi:MAG: helix-turn-helix domain-containing protein [Planctomycetes bacterium]|nr:helix-turn-helix domain-containing protein [Planctomycetota bacterium]
MLTIEELATYLKLRPQTIYKWAQQGRLPGAKFGKEWRFRRSDIERWIDDHMPKGTGPRPGARAAGRLAELKDGPAAPAAVPQGGPAAGSDKGPKKRRGRRKKESGPEAN